MKWTHKLRSASNSSFPSLPFQLCSAVSPASRGSEEESFATSQTTFTVFFHKKGQSCTDRASVVRAPRCHPERVESCLSHPSSGRESLESQGIALRGRSGAGEAGGCSERPLGQGMGFAGFGHGQVLGHCNGEEGRWNPRVLYVCQQLRGQSWGTLTQLMFYCVRDDRKALQHWVQGALLLSQDSSASAADGEGTHQEKGDCCSSSETGAVIWVSQRPAPFPGSSSFPIRTPTGLPAGSTFARGQSCHPHTPFRRGCSGAKCCSLSTSGGWDGAKRRSDTCLERCFNPGSSTAMLPEHEHV